MRPHFALYGAACTALLTMMLYVPGAAAQNAARATIPFAFTANERMLPAGTYQVQLEGRSYLSLKNCETGHGEESDRTHRGDRDGPDEVTLSHPSA